MGKFGLGKKSAGDDDDSSNRSALFGSRFKSSKSPQPASVNPYANLPSQADAYNAAKARAGVPGYAQRGPSPAPPPNGSRGPDRGGFQDERQGPLADANQDGREGSFKSQPGNRYGDTSDGGSYRNEKQNSGYGANPYGAQGGYGGDRYGSGSATGGAGGAPRHAAGGYGGLGPAPSSNHDADDNRDALFGGARDRMAQRKNPQQAGYAGAENPPPYEEGQPPRHEPSYEPYGDRHLTAEEEEEEDVTAAKQEIRFIKQSDVSSTRNALRIAAQAEETGMNTLARIGAQGERIHNTEKNLDLTSNHNRSAEDKARELKKLNRSLFAVHVSNPFTSSSRAEQRDLDILERHHVEREQREATRRAMYQTDQRMQRTFKDMSDEQGGRNARASKQAALAERAKYQFEADSEDDEMENEIDSNLDALGAAAGRLNGLARATGKEVDEQNQHLERINMKSSKVDDEIAMNRARLDRFH